MCETHENTLACRSISARWHCRREACPTFRFDVGAELPCHVQIMLSALWRPRHQNTATPVQQTKASVSHTHTHKFIVCLYSIMYQNVCICINTKSLWPGRQRTWRFGCCVVMFVLCISHRRLFPLHLRNTMSKVMSNPCHKNLASTCSTSSGRLCITRTHRSESNNITYHTEFLTKHNNHAPSQKHANAVQSIWIMCSLKRKSTETFPIAEPTFGTCYQQTENHTYHTQNNESIAQVRAHCIPLL